MVNARLNKLVKESLLSALTSDRDPKAETAGVPPPVGVRIFAVWPMISAQQLQHARLRLVGECKRGDRDRLAGRQRLAVGRLLGCVGPRSGLQDRVAALWS